MNFSDLKTDRSIILKYVFTGMGGFSLGIIIGTLISLVAGFLNIAPMNSEIIISITIICAFIFGASFFGIVSKDFKKMRYYGAAGTAMGILTIYCFMTFGLNYYISLLILPVWGFVIGLPRLRSAVIPAFVGIAGGIFINLLIFLITSLPLQPKTFFVLMPSLAFLYILMFSSVIGLTVYAAEKIKGNRGYFNDALLTTSLSTSMSILIIAVFVFTIIIAFLSATSDTPSDVFISTR